MNEVSKVFNKLMVIDASYLLHRNLNVGTLWDLKSSTGQRTGGIMGFFRSLNSIMDYEHYPVLCWDSKVSPRRLEIYPDYKKNGQWVEQAKIDTAVSTLLTESTSLDSALSKLEVPDDFDESEVSFLDQVKAKMTEVLSNRKNHGTDSDPDNYGIQYRDQRYQIMEICRALGIPSIRFYEWEGDDLIALFTRMTEKSVVITDDWDMVQLLNPDGSVDINRVLNKEYLTHDEFLVDNNYSNIREFTIIKAIVGDGSDNIPGVARGCGNKRAAEVAKIILECNEDPELYLPRLESELGRFQYMTNFLANHDDYLRNMQLVDLTLVPNEPDILDKMVAETFASLGKPDLLTTLSKLGNLEITSFDVNSAISKLNISSLNCKL